MKYFNIIAFAALFGLSSGIKLRDNSDLEGRNVDQTTWRDMHISGYNGADEDEIMDNIFSKYSNTKIHKKNIL